MSTQDVKSKYWIKLNLIGTYAVIFLGPILFLIISDGYSQYPYYATVREILASIINWFVLGLAIGLAQQIGLYQWNIYLKHWAILTAICTFLPIFLLTIGVPQLRWYFLGNPAITELIKILYDARYWIAFICVSAVQAFMLRNSVSKSWRWSLAYFAAFIVLIIALVLITGIAFAIAEPLEKLLYTNELYYIVIFRDELLFLVLMLVLPIPTASLFGYLTAKMLRSGSVIEKDNTG